MFQSAEHILYTAVQWLRLALEAVGATVVAVGGIRGIMALVGGLVSGGERTFGIVRLTLARYLSLALEFQLAADILSTAIAPTWDQIGKLGAIAVIRTGLNFFLAREMAAEDEGPAGAPRPPQPG